MKDSKAFEVFAQCYPHEAYRRDPEQFWQYFHEQIPGATREEMETLLRETENDTEETERNKA